MARKGLLILLNIIIGLGILSLIALPMALILPGVPEIWYQIDATAVDKEVANITADLGTQPNDYTPKQFIANNRPKFDPTLSTENQVIINSIGVDGKIYEGSNAERTLAKGIWRTNTFGSPDMDNLPTILASHRYGNPKWSSDFRDKEIFYNLDKVKVGDKVDIIWNQRLYHYQVYKTDVARQVDDNNFSLMLYTCNYWNSPLRIFVYLNRV